MFLCQISQSIVQRAKNPCVGGTVFPQGTISYLFGFIGHYFQAWWFSEHMDNKLGFLLRIHRFASISIPTLCIFYAHYYMNRELDYVLE